MGSYGKSDFKIIRVKPTLSTDAYAQGDVLFTSTEIPNAVIGNGGCSKLVAMFIMDKQDGADDDTIFVFHQNNTQQLGTINASADVSDSNLETMKVTGVAFNDGSDASSGAHIDNARIQQVYPASGSNEDSFQLQFLQAEDDSTSVYISGLNTGTSNPTFADGDLELIFHIEYR